MKARIFISALFLILFVQVSSAQVPNTFSYQGILKNANGQVVPDGNYNLLFKLYESATGGTALWTESQSVAINSGAINIIIGSVQSLAGIEFNKQYYLGITVNSGVELSPRVKLTAVPYSLNTRSIPDNSVTTSKISDNAVTQSKISASGAAAGRFLKTDGTGLVWDVPSITPSDNSITTAKIADGAVSNSKIADNAVTQSKISASGAASGKFLKTDGTGLVWDTPGGFSLPYSATANSTSDLFSITNSGTGGVGRFIISNSNNNSNGALYVYTNGIGKAAQIYSDNSNATTALYISSNGSGEGIKVISSGTGTAAYFVYDGLSTGSRLAARFDGNVQINGTLSKSAGSFTIDHPLDPENKVLRHSFTESPEMMNIYKGRGKLRNGEAIMLLPEYFDSLNHPDGREINLTCINGWSPLFLEGKIENNKFIVKTTANGNPDQEFSWIIYAVRNDKYAQDHPIIVEEEKGANNGFIKGEYLSSDANKNK